jgi:UDP-glucose 4-epimerase
MRILITGGAGCLGSSLVEKFIPNGHDVLVIDNFATGRKELLPDVQGLQVVEGTIADEVLVNKIFDEFQPTHVINSAAAYKDLNNWGEDTRTNIIGSINVAKAALKLGVEKFINFQTALCYGKPSIVPIPITHPTMPFTSYGISKTAGESYLLMSDLPVISLRLANICGPRLSIGPIPTFYKRLKEGKSVFCSDTVRDFLDISDFLSLIDVVLTSDIRNSGVFNVSTGEGHSIEEVFNEVREFLKLDVPNAPIVPPGADDVKVVVLDPSKTEETFSWKAKVNFKETIHNQLKWYNDYGINEIYSHLLPYKK